MKAYAYDSFDIEALTQKESSLPSPGSGEVRVMMRASSLNYRDLLMIKGEYHPRQPLPLVPLSDGVGVVDEIGPDVTRVRVGDRVAPTFCQQWLRGKPEPASLRSTLGGPLDGVLREAIVCAQNGVVRVPEPLSDVEAATLPCAALTAWSALVTHGQLTPGQTVLILGTGGVSLFALQFAKAMGATVIACSSDDGKIQLLQEMGADLTFNYLNTPEWGRHVLAETDKIGVDHVIEVGGAKTLAKSIRAVRLGGFVHLIGVLSGRESVLDLTPVLMRQIRIQGVFVGHREAFEEMNRFIVAHDIHPVVDTVFPFANAKRAFRYFESNRRFGKVCITMP